MESIIYSDLVELDDDCTIIQYLEELSGESKPRDPVKPDGADETNDETIEKPMEI